MCVYIYFCGGDHKNIEREILLCMYIYTQWGVGSAYGFKQAS